MLKSREEQIWVLTGLLCVSGLEVTAGLETETETVGNFDRNPNPYEMLHKLYPHIHSDLYVAVSVHPWNTC